MRRRWSPAEDSRRAPRDERSDDRVATFEHPHPRMLERRGVVGGHRSPRPADSLDVLRVGVVLSVVNRGQIGVRWRVGSTFPCRVPASLGLEPCAQTPNYWLTDMDGVLVRHKDALPRRRRIPRTAGKTQKAIPRVDEQLDTPPSVVCRARLKRTGLTCRRRSIWHLRAGHRTVSHDRAARRVGLRRR